MRGAAPRSTARVLLALLVRSLCTAGWSASSEDLNRVPVRSPLTSADPFNAAAAGSWTNGQQPPPRDRFGRFVYLPSEQTVPYASYFTISGRACGYLYVDAEDRLPRAGSRVRLSADTSIVLSVLQVNTKGRPSGSKSLPGGRIYAYLCAVDGQYHRMGGGAGRWTYDVWRQAETGEPMYADTGVVAPPHFIELPAAGSVAAQTDPCADRPDWRSLDHQLTCRNYRGGAKDRNWCSDMGYIDPSLLDPRDKTGKVEWNVPAYVACPTACRMCVSCTLNVTKIERDERLLARLGVLRSRSIVIDGCRVGYDCADLRGAPLMVDGERIPTEFDLLKEADARAKRDYVPVPAFNSELAAYLEELQYTCKLSRVDQPLQEVERSVVDMEPGSVFETVFSLRVFSATPHSLVRYTLDGSDPQHDHGHLVESGGVVELRQSAQVKAMAYLNPASHVAIRQSRIVTLPYIRIRLASPELEISSVGHYRRAWGQVQAECAPNSSWVSSQMAARFEVVRSNACPGYASATSDTLNVARHQAWRFQLPRTPVLAFEPLAMSHVSGVIGVAKNGVPIFAPPPTAADEAFVRELEHVDACGGLAMTIRRKCDGGPCLFETDYHGQYHYRVLPSCLDTHHEADGHSGIIAIMLDGIPLYGVRDAGGAPPADLDACGGHVDAARPWYHYHASAHFPYTVGCLRGCLDAQTLMPVNAPLVALATGSCMPAQTQPVFAGFRTAPWLAAPAVSETALLLAGNYAGSVAVQVTCPMHPGGLAALRFSTNGQDPAIGGAPGEGFALGSMQIIVSDMIQVRARCEAPFMEPSAVLNPQHIEVTSVAYNPHWAATLGFWNLTDDSTFVGSFAEPRSAVQGGCSEVFATHISPAFVSDLSGGLGDMLFVPPDCKAGRAEWDVEQQPTLNTIFGEHRGIKGILLDTSRAVNGLRVPASVQELVAAQKLPLEQLSVEVWAALMAGTEGALVGVVFKASGFLGKGWYLGWESDTSSPVAAQHTVTFVMTLSTEATDNFGRGGLATVRATFPKLQVAQHWVHVGATYDGRHLALYVNGSLAATEPACRRQFCGRITYPMRDTTYVLNDLHLSIGALEFNGRKLRHNGYIAMVRVMGQAVEEPQMRAAAARLTLPLALSWCPPGTYGPYDGIQPCSACEPGYYSALGGQTLCQPCPAGFYADTPAAINCKMCPSGLLTRAEGSANVSDCSGPDYCQTLLHNCGTFATCSSTPGSFQCACLPGFYGDGVACSPACGDGLKVHGEEVRPLVCPCGPSPRS